ncbi:hypothetical protein R1sor_025201 [Riccia sorocarpa]|uniref:CCHC-type domain-containing protein n=1 Tax=Riccia sorocarpa TaxID=122646 RepID=A0ABD3G7Y6_9MARC
MAGPPNSGGKGGKIFQGGKAASQSTVGTGNVQGQVANLRPAGAPLLQQEGPSSPQNQQMDYKQAVSPAKTTAGNHSNMISYGSQSQMQMMPYNLQMHNPVYLDSAGYSDFQDGLYLGQTQAIIDKRGSWINSGAGQSYQGQENNTSNFQHHQPNDEEDFEMHTSNPDDYPTIADRGKSPASEEQNEHLQDIPEEEDGDSESESAESEHREASYIERHSAWVHVLDENIQKTRKNPADRTASMEFEMDMSDLCSAVDDIIETSEHDGKIETDALMLDSRLFAEGIKKMQQNSLVIHTVDLRVTMAYFERWAEVTLHQLLGVKVVSICQLDPFCFHVQVDSGTAKAHIFANSPLKMGNKTVFSLPWDTRFSTKDLKSRAVPVWLELYNVHPGLMRFGLNMLRKIGPIIYAAKNTETQRINIVRGCVLMDLSKPLPDVIPIVLPEVPGKIMKQRIRYLRLPDACFSCRQRGHFARSCPLNEGRTDTPTSVRTPSPQRNTPDGKNGAQEAQRTENATPNAKSGATGEGNSRYTRDSTGIGGGVQSDQMAEAEASDPQQGKQTGKQPTHQKGAPDSSGGSSGISSSSGPFHSKEPQENMNGFIIREALNTGGNDNGGKMSGAKHLQEDREKRL